ncbi:MAG: glycosyltransferase [Caldilineaceae bacterium]|nr:glycosyltransferase [Caldilineaceae bacterium]
MITLSTTALSLLLLASFTTLALLVMGGIALYNLLTFPRLTPPHALQPPATEQAYPPLSILIPARNESATIGQTVSQLLAQSYPTVELIVLDDHSTDATAQHATLAADGDPRFRLVRGDTLPIGWSGKNWACHQLAHLARYDQLLFTDADVQWHPGALLALSAMQQTTQADLLTVWPTQITQRWAERLVVPLMAFAVLAYLPVALVHDTPYPLAAAANGQCLLFQRRAYRACGGHAAIHDRVLDDVLLAQRIKASGSRLRMADGAGLVSCRMYRSSQETINGYAKNILAGHGESTFRLCLSTLFHLLLFVAPWLWLIAGGIPNPDRPLAIGWPLWPLALIVAGILIRGMTAYSSRQRLYDSLWMPFSVLCMTYIAGQALWWQWRHGGPQWKGRTLHKATR